MIIKGIMKTCNPWHPFPQAKVGRVPVGSARSGRKRFTGKSSSPEAPVFSRKTLHSRDTHLLTPVEWNPRVPRNTIMKMERMNLNEAELTVTTQYMIDISQRTDYNMTLSDYGDMQEFLCCCSELFPQERHPQYRYVAWDNIPSILINREWLCPNFFDIRDAFDQLDDEDMEDFERWCARYGYDLRIDNPHLLVAHYRNMYGDNVSYNAECYLPDTDNESSSCICYPEGWFDQNLLRQEIFGDNYD